MAERSAFFPSLLRSLLVEQRVTPSRLASMVGLKTESVEGWLSASQMPKAASVWAAAGALGGHEDDLLFSAFSWYCDRIEDQYPANTALRLDKSASAYLGESGWWERIPEADQHRFLHIWRGILEREIFVPTSRKEELPVSDLIILPTSTLIVDDEWADIVKHIAKDGSQLYQMDWRRFEDLIAELLARYGWQTTPMGYTKDDGIDIVAVRRLAPDMQFKMMVQCKRLAKNRKVGIELVREVWSVKWEKGFHQAMIATTSTFTRGARQKGESWDLALRDHDTIVQWCRGLQSSAPGPKLL